MDVNAELKEICEKLLEMVETNEWQSRNMAENRFCPFCCSADDDWKDQMEHHAGCKYVETAKRAKELIIQLNHEMIKCKNCKHWSEYDEEGEIIYGYPRADVMKPCQRALSYHQHPKSDEMTSYEVIATGPEFGCIHGENK